MASLSIRTLPVLALAAALCGQGTCDLDKTSNGAIGRNFGLQLSNAPANRSFLFMVSTNAGPVPLSLVDPRDPRSLSVGLEMAGFWFTGPTGTGSRPIGIPIPNDSRLAGGILHCQVVTYFGTTLAFGALSNPVIQQLGLVDTPTTLPAQLIVSRALASAFQSGRTFLIAGGGQGNLLGAVGLASTELYDVRSMSVTAGPTMTSPRALTAAVELSDGRVLLAGGVDNTGAVIATAEVYEPATGTFTATSPMSRPRALHSATLLADGRVLVVGGTTSLADALSAIAGSQDSTEIWNPATGNWSAAATMSDRLLGPGLTTLQNGRVLMSGGFDIDIVVVFPVPVGAIARCQLYDPGTNSWSGAAAMNAPRMAHGLNALCLGDGRVLVTGGVTSGPDPTTASALDSSEIYAPGANAWTTLPAMATPRTLHSATALPSGKVLIAGGASGTISAPVELASVQELDLATRTWRTLPPLRAARAAHSAVLTSDGLVVLFGGQGQGGTVTLSSIETIRP